MKLVLKILVIFILVAGIALLAYWALSPPQISQIYLKYADYQASHGQNVQAMKYYEKSLDIHPKNTAARSSAIDFYYSQSNLSKVEYHLLESINQYPSSSDPYIRLCNVYIDQGKFMDAVDLLNNISNPVAKQSLSSARPLAPELNPQTGTYRESFEIDMRSDENTTIYYSTDGSYPSSANVYTSPITPDAGEITVMAVAVNSIGLISPVTRGVYKYEQDIPSVAFVDAGFESIVRSILNIPQGEISSGKLRSITHLTNSLDGNFVELSSLDDFIWLTGLETLELTYARVTPGPIMDLKNLRILSLHDCNLKSSLLGNISNLENLELLDFSKNLISSLDFLSGLQNLHTLILRDNSIIDISPLSSLQNLTSLNLSSNAIENISALQSLTELTEASLDLNKISDIGPLGHLTGLISLSITNNNITNIESLGACTSLETLDISHNGVELLAPLQTCTNLISLTAIKNQVADISALAALSNMQYLNLSTNLVETIGSLSQCVSLVTLNISKNFITDVSPLALLPNLAEINMENNSISGINTLVTAPMLTTVYAFGNKITDASKLEEVAITVYK